jgi:hypothetical protein
MTITNKRLNAEKENDHCFRSRAEKYGPEDLHGAAFIGLRRKGTH